MGKSMVGAILEAGGSFKNYPEYKEYDAGDKSVSEKDLYDAWVKLCRAYVIDHRAEPERKYGVDDRDLVKICARNYWQAFLWKDRARWYQIQYWFRGKSYPED